MANMTTLPQRSRSGQIYHEGDPVEVIHEGVSGRKPGRDGKYVPVEKGCRGLYLHTVHGDPRFALIKFSNPADEHTSDLELDTKDIDHAAP